MAARRRDETNSPVPRAGKATERHFVLLSSAAVRQFLMVSCGFSMNLAKSRWRILLQLANPGASVITRPFFFIFLLLSDRKEHLYNVQSAQNTH